MSAISPTSYVSTVAAHLQQQNELWKQQVQVDLDVGESVRRARQQSVEQSMQDLSKQAERLTEIKRTGLEMRGVKIDVWA